MFKFLKNEIKDKYPTIEVESDNIPHFDPVEELVASNQRMIDYLLKRIEELQTENAKLKMQGNNKPMPPPIQKLSWPEVRTQLEAEARNRKALKQNKENPEGI